MFSLSNCGVRTDFTYVTPRKMASSGICKLFLAKRAWRSMKDVDKMVISGSET